MAHRICYGVSEDCITLELLDAPKSGGFVGTIQSLRLPAQVMIELSDRESQLDLQMACVAAAPMQSLVLMLVDPRVYEGLKKRELTAEFIVLHELGHYVNGDLDAFLEAHADPRDNRLYLLETDHVCRRELQADAFALRYLGKQVTEANSEKSLQFIRRISASAGLTPRESQDRITAIRRLCHS